LLTRSFKVKNSIKSQYLYSNRNLRSAAKSKKRPPQITCKALTN
jgi:hypothetical protein